MIRLRIGCDFFYESAVPTSMMLIVRPAGWERHRIIEEVRLLEPDVPVRDFVDTFGNFCWRFTAPAGSHRIYYDAIAEVPAEGDVIAPRAPKLLTQELPDDVLVYTLPSRHVQSDLFMQEAWSRFGNIHDGWEQVQAICDYLHETITYGDGSNSSVSGYEAYIQRRGVCRDFAHIAIAFCRALNIPARYISGYLADIGDVPPAIPMDFHAWFEVFLGGHWYAFDARHNMPRVGRVRIGRGRDAVDVALATIYGSSQLTSLSVWADEVDRTVSVYHTPRSIVYAEW